MTKRIRCGLVGLGRISAKHLEAMERHRENLDLVAVCDGDDVALKNLAAPGIQRFTDLGKMIKEIQLDAVSVCTPSGLHAEHGIQAAEAGCHVVMEKPMAVAWEDGIRLHDTCKARKVKLFVVLQNRYNPTIQALKQAIVQGRFGRIYMISSNVFWARPQSYYDQAPWRGTWKMDGGAFMNQASHNVDMLYWLGGEVESVQSTIGTLERRIEAEDTGATIVRYKNGGIGSLNVTMLTYPQNREGSVTVLGEKGFVRIGGTAMNVIETWEFRDALPQDAQVTAASYDTDSVYGDGHHIFYAGVIKALQQNVAPEIDGEQGLRSLEILTAIYDSAKAQRSVTLPLAKS